MNSDRPLLELLIVFAPLSLLAVGGGNSILGDVQNQAVVQHAWLTQKQFEEAFAISRVTPGPGMLIVTLIGWKVAGWLGALVATVAIMFPATLVLYMLARVWHAGGSSRWRNALGRGLAPIAAGLILASVTRLVSHAEAPLLTGIVVAGTAALAQATRGQHIVLLAVGATAFAGLSLLS